MMIEKSGSIRLKDISVAGNLPPEQQALAAGMVRVTHLYRSALKVAVTQMEILDEEFARMYDHSPIHHIEYRIKSLDSIVDKLKRRGFEVSIDNIYAHIQDLAGIYKSERQFTDDDAARLRLCSDAISEIDQEMQDIYQGKEPRYHA